jgi:beta-phosphoglucomutase
MIKACIFNLEGVIIDTQNQFFQALERLENRWGLEVAGRPPHSDVLYGATRLQALNELIQRSGQAISESQKAELMQTIDQEIADHVADITPDDLEEGVLLFIKELKNKGMSIGVVSAFPNTTNILNRLRITHLFHSVTEAQGGGFASVSTYTYLQMAADLGFPPGEILVFEHTSDGTAAASAAEFFVVGIGKAEDLHDQADLVIPDFDSLRFMKIITALGIIDQ